MGSFGAALGRLAQTPRHYLADPALAAHLLGLDDDALAAGPAEPDFSPAYGSVAGRLLESLIGLSLRTYAQASDARLSHLRTRDGAREVDFIDQRGQRIVAIEVKLARTVSDDDVRRLVWLRERLGPRLAEALIVTTGSDAYRRRSDGAVVAPAALLGP